MTTPSSPPPPSPTPRRRRRRLDRVGLLLLGLLAGILVSAVALYWYVDRSRTRQVEERIQVALGLPDEAFELEDVEEDGSLRIVLRQVAFMDKAGDTIVSAPTARGRLLARTLSTDGPIVVDQVVLERPFMRLLQRASGDWNFFDIFKAEAAGAALNVPEEEQSRPIALQGVRIVDGTLRVATPYAAPANPPTGRLASLKQPERVRSGGRTYTVRWLRDVQGALPLVRIGPNGGWRAEIGSLTADVTNPDTRIAALAGWVEQDPDETIRFDIATFRTPRSSFDGEGRVRFADAGPVFDLNVRAHSLAFADLQGMGFPIPAAGTAEFALAARSQPGGRTLWRMTDARVSILDSRAAGRLTVLTGPDTEPVFSDTRISLDPLVLTNLEELGYVDPLPLVGTVRGEIASLDVLEAGEGGPLRIDLAASLLPRNQSGGAPSVIAASGLVRWTPDAESMARFSGLRVEARPLRLEHLAAIQEQPNELLRGTLTGAATLSGTPADLRIEDGDLTYAVGDAPETVLRGLSGRWVNGTTPRWEISARAQPLALATLTELFPALPFRTATLSGPIRASGVGDNVTFDADLQGASGGIAMEGSVVLGEPLRFDVNGRLSAFRASGVLTSSVPLEGPLSGTFSARGAADDFRFAVDMTQGGGSFNLAGNVRRAGTDPFQFDVAGRVDNFRIGALIGQPGLLPGPVSGPIAVSGGGRQPYRFDVALTGEQGLFDVEGYFAPGDVPTYAVSGRIQGLDLSALPGGANLPDTRLTGTIDVEGRGTTPETFAGRVAFDAAPGSTVGGVALEAATVRLTAAEGVLRIQSLTLGVRGARLEASGALGLNAPAPEVLRFTVDAPNLGVLAALLPPPGAFEPAVAGSLRASGWVGGTLRFPEVAVNGRGSGLRWQTYAADQLAFDARLQKGPSIWTGSVNLNGEGLAFGSQTFRALALEANLAPEAASFGIDLRKDANTDLRASGILELAGLTPTGVLLREMDLRLRDVHWTLAVPEARLSRTDAGLVVQNLRLERGGAATGFIEANGTLPTAGTADLVIRAGGIDLAELRQLAPTMPDVGGTLALEASIIGPVDEPRLLLNAGVDSLTYGDFAADSVAVRGEYAARRMALNANLFLAGDTLVDATASVPMNLTLGGLVPGFELLRDDPLEATIHAHELPLALVAAAVPTALSNGEGAAVAQVRVTGTLNEPQVAGNASLAGALTIVPLGVRWTGIDAALRLEGQRIIVERALARTAAGSASVSGQVLLDQGQTPLVNLVVVLDNFQVINNPDLAELEADARLDITGRLPRAEISGEVNIEDGTIHIPDLGEQAEADIVDVEVGALGADTVSASVTSAAGLVGGLIPRDVRVSIGESVWLQSNEARIQIATDNPLNIYEAGGQPRIFGDVRAERGTYRLQVGPIEREFEIEEGTVSFAGTPELNPRIDIRARYEVRSREPGTADIGVIVQLGGTLQQPTLALSSDTRPPLPQSELLTLLVFGRRSSELANIPQEFTQGIILEQLVGGALTSSIEEAFADLGVFDYVRLRGRPASSGLGGGIGNISSDIFAYASIEFGKEVFDDFFLVMEVVDLLSAPRVGFSAEYEATQTWTFRGAWEPVRRDPLLLNLDRRSRQILLEARRRWEYGRPPPQDIELDEGPPPPDAEPGPAEQSTPTGQPPPTPPPDAPP
ncbi:translocation/assembly module TamB [Longimicrobium sp.]|uniref:translocation/assembly module TamB domain-containing protein n=1 Tax=Longimicrobium sp. TaxID=2029185 RepID=UPI002E3170C9|nr:translocation/assembly module TamB [Longimicrobium sp.]HEX6041920.1 translocation/assembly module TamB [Longimicrobium sp.]